MRSKIFLVSFLTLIISEALLNACGSSASVSEPKGFDPTTFTPNDADPSRRIGANQDGPFALYGKVVGSEFVIKDYVDSSLATQWSPLVKLPKGLRGGEIMSAPWLELSPSYVPMSGSDFRSEEEHWSALNFWACSRNPNRRNNEGSFQIRMRYKQNGEEKVATTRPIAIVHNKAPSYGDTSPPGMVKLESIINTGTITDFVIEIGMIVPRVFSGQCTFTEDTRPDRELVSNRFNINIIKITLPYAANK